MCCLSTKRGTEKLPVPLGALCTLGVTAVPNAIQSKSWSLRVERDRQTVTISHREILGYMPAMAMPFRVEERGRTLRPGAPVRASNSS